MVTMLFIYHHRGNKTRKHFSDGKLNCKTSCNFSSPVSLIPVAAFSSVQYASMLNNLSLKYDFDWSFRPIILFLRCVGIDLSPTDGKMSMRRWLSHCYTLIWFILNVYVNVHFRFLSMHIIEENFTTFYNFTMNVIITFGFVGNHLLLLCVVRPRFGHLINSFRLLENQLSNQHVFTKIRRYSLSCVAFILLLVFS